MFRIPAFFVEDKNLPKVLTALQGLALNLEAPQPVTNAVVKNGKVAAAKPEASSMKEQVLSKIAELPSGTVFTVANLKQIITSVGGAESSHSHFTKEIKKAKLAKMRSRGHYVRT